MEQTISRIRSGSVEPTLPENLPTNHEEARLFQQLEEMGRELRLLKAAQSSNERRFSEQLPDGKERDDDAGEELQRLRHENFLLGQQIIRQAEKFGELRLKNVLRRPDDRLFFVCVFSQNKTCIYKCLVCFPACVCVCVCDRQTGKDMAVRLSSSFF